MLDVVLTSIYYLIAATLWYAIYRSGRAMAKRVRIRKYLGGMLLFGLTIFLLWVGLEFGAVPGSSAYKSCYYTRRWFGKAMLLGSPRFNYDSERSFTGDGYSIDVYDISDSFAAWAASPPADFSTSYPVNPGFRSHWKSTTWHKTPIPSEELKFLDFALDVYTSDPKLAAARSLLEKLANEPGNHISIRYFMHGDYVGDVDFFLLSPSEKVFILVNHNT